MLSIIPRSALGLVALAAAFIVSSSAHAVTCEDVRNLTTAEQAYWSKRLNLTPAERYRIWLTCYKAPRDGTSSILVRQSED